jgi:ribosomal protein S18 acetylase RimI-like enzyme
MGWHPKRKWREMGETEMRFLIVRDCGNTEDFDGPESKMETSIKDLPISGFCSFMLTHEDGNEVIYIYEIHLKSSAIGTGLGKHLINIVEQVGTSVGVKNSMLTVFRSNTRAVSFYEHLGYGIDEYSPQAKSFRDGTVKEADYLIMSKRLPASKDGHPWTRKYELMPPDSSSNRRKKRSS